jgi:exosortase
MIPRAWIRNGWTVWHAIGAVALTALGIVVTWEAWVDIFNIAVKDEESSHIFLVPVVAGWLVWVRRSRFRQCHPRGGWIGPLLVAAGWAAFGYGYHHAAQSIWHAGAVLVVLGCLLSVLGMEIPRRVLPAVLVLVFLIPVPGMVRQQVAIPLQTTMAELTQTLFAVMGLSVERNGNLLSINGVDVAIAEACNGLRMVFALVLVSYAFAFGTPLYGYVRLLIVAASPLSAILCNVIRMVPTVWLYGNVRAELADRFHDLAGWVMLGVAFLLLMGIIRVLRWALIPVCRYTLAYN